MWLGAACAVAIYLTGAFQHADRMNLVKRQGDQSAYVQYAKDLHANWSGQRPPIAGDRNRMPLYPAFQALFYTPELSDEAFFARGKKTSIVLSVALLGAVYLVARLALGPLAGASLTAIAGFTCFIFKAGYFQAELLYYTLHFAAFVAICRLLSARSRSRMLAWAAVAGAAAAVSHLAKAAALPVIVLGAIAILAGALTPHHDGPRASRARALLFRTGVAAVFVATFLAVLSPYLLTSKRVFGHYFYNVNSTFYVWYDDWGDAVRGTRAHGDRVGWPRLLPDQLPGPRKYWREHTVGEIGARIFGGLGQMAVDLWSGFWVTKFVLLSIGCTAAVAWRRRDAVLPIVPYLPIGGFVVAYFVASLALAAFYAPISGTGVARFALAHYLPLLFVTAAIRWGVASAERNWRREQRWATGSEWFMVATLALDIPFSIWPRLLTTYGGF